MSYRITRLFILIFVFFAMPLWAAEKPRALATDSRIKIVNYTENQVYPIHANTFVETEIQFGKDEIIEDIQNGDLSAWQAKVPAAFPNRLFIKPTIVGTQTNMTVVTNRRTYFFALNSSPTKTNTNVTYAIEFRYPDQMQNALNRRLRFQKAQNQANLNRTRLPRHYQWNYQFSGDRSIMPLHVFDDGRFTYLQLRPHQSIPAIFAVTNRRGEESVVNDRRRGNYLVIQRIAPQFTLRDGKYHVASLFNTQLIQQLNRRG